MPRFDVDTAALSAEGASVQQAAEPLAAARAALSRVQGDGYAADDPGFAGALEGFIAGWGASVAALHEAALGLGEAAIGAAAAYETTDASQMGGG